MPDNLILPDNELVNKFFEKYKLEFYYSKPVLKHIKEFILAAISKGFSAKTTDIAEYSSNHRTTIAHFLSKGVWKEEYLQLIIRDESLKFTFNHSQDTGEPLFIIHDDTICQKTKPSSQAKSPIEDASFHRGNKYGHQLLATMINCGEYTLINDLQRYNKQKQSKIDAVMDIAKSMPVPPNKAYALFDSWYNCPKIINAYAKHGYHCIGGLKTNRIIYPQGIRIGISNFVDKYVQKSDVHLVTVNNSEYWTYRYEGPLNDIENAVVILTWLKDSFKKPKSLKAFLSTDVSLDTVTILEYYSKRWPIEIFFRQEKLNLGLDKYQIRSIKGIERIWTLQSLVHLFCTIGLDKPMKFGEGLLKARKQNKKEYVTWIYKQAQSEVPIDIVLELLNIA